MRLILIDNYDSYTFNLYQLLAGLKDVEASVVRNDEYSWEQLAALNPDAFVISPGPGTPKNDRDVGICAAIIRNSEVPILGVCLGHQAIGHFFGAGIEPASEIMHGKLSPIFHDGDEIFRGLPQGFQAVRYHSLIVNADLPPALVRSAWTVDGTVMGLRHVSKPIWGVQFHPESVRSEHGLRLLDNFCELVRTRTKLRTAAGSPSSSLRPGPEAGVVPRSTRSHPNEGRLAVRHRSIAGLVDPEQTFLSLYAGERHAFWLDSSHVENGLSRFSFLGAPTSLQDVFEFRVPPAHSGTATDDDRSLSAFSFLAERLTLLACDAGDLPFEFNGGFVGYLGYEMRGECGAPVNRRSTFPDAAFLFIDRFIAFDHLQATTTVVALSAAGEHAEADAWIAETVRRLEEIRLRPATPLPPAERRGAAVCFELAACGDEYLRQIKTCLDELERGESYEVCLTNEIRSALSIDPLFLYRHLRRCNPAPFAAFLRFGDVSILSSSPERFLRIGRNREIEAKPIKGTAARGAAGQEDERLREGLRVSAKDQAENLMVVDMLRNDLGVVSKIGSVHVPKLMAIESYAGVHQMVSTVCGVLRDDLSVVDAVRAAFPGASMTGAPKRRTMEIIDRLECRPRGIYSGALGYWGLNGSMDLSMTIRTIVHTPGRLSIGSGGGVVIDSLPEQELEEMLLKAQRLIDAIVLAVGAEGYELR